MDIARLPRPRICYIEIPAADPHASADFYERVFGWNIRHRDTAHPSFDDACGVVSGMWATGREPNRTPGLIVSVWVDDIEATLAAVAAHGGEVVMPVRRDAPDGEWIAHFRDPAGNVIGLYQERRR